MVSQGPRPLSEVLADHQLVTAAINRGIREALLTHARLGNSVSGVENGQLVTLTPAEIFARFGADSTPDTKKS